MVRGGKLILDEHSGVVGPKESCSFPQTGKRTALFFLFLICGRKETQCEMCLIHKFLSVQYSVVSIHTFLCSKILELFQD